MKKLPKYLLHYLDQIAKADKTWTITMTEDYAKAATRLQDLGLVSLIPRLARGGRFKGMHTRGSDYVVTPEGRELLARDLER